MEADRYGLLSYIVSLVHDVKNLKLDRLNENNTSYSYHIIPADTSQYHRYSFGLYHTYKSFQSCWGKSHRHNFYKLGSNVTSYITPLIDIEGTNARRYRFETQGPTIVYRFRTNVVYVPNSIPICVFPKMEFITEEFGFSFCGHSKIQYDTLYSRMFGNSMRSISDSYVKFDSRGEEERCFVNRGILQDSSGKHLMLLAVQTVCINNALSKVNLDSYREDFSSVSMTREDGTPSKMFVLFLTDELYNNPALSNLVRNIETYVVPVFRKMGINIIRCSSDYVDTLAYNLFSEADLKASMSRGDSSITDVQEDARSIVRASFNTWVSFSQDEEE